jgi:hypothetical protein
MRHHRLSALVLATTLSVLMVPPVLGAAGRTAHVTGTFERTTVSTGICAFPVTVHGSNAYVDTIFLDNQGNVVRLLETVQHGVLDFSAHGRSITASGTGGFDATFASDGSSVLRTFGIDLLAVLPGTGPIILDAGYGVFSFDGGMHVLFEAGPASYDIDAFCGALS